MARDGGSWERDTGCRLGSGSDQFRPDSEARRGELEQGKRGLGGQSVTPTGRSLTAPPVRRAVSTAAVRTGSQGLEVGSAARGPGAGETESRRGLGGQQVTPPGRATRPSSGLRPRSGERSALPQSGQDRGSLRGGALDRGNGGPADSWTAQPGRPAIRDYHSLGGSRPQWAGQPA